MPRVRISWPYGCKHLAMVAGSWTQWHPQELIPSQVSYSSEEIWSTEISLPDNVDEVFRFKFIIDGEWMYNSGLPVIPNNHGSFDNYIKVSPYLSALDFRILDFGIYFKLGKKSSSKPT